ncbi:MAG: diversity-generating retroelement protein Avd [Burkholderiales bacterium]
MAEASKKRAPRAEGARRYGPALEKAYQFMLWLIPAVEKFPRGQRFLLGDRIQTTALDALEGLIEATYSREVGAILTRVNLMLEKLRFLFRLAKDLRYLDLKRYEFVARAVDEIGRLVGGWMKAGHAAQT